MPPLTLEQVLARSMRLPRQRAENQVSGLFPRQAPHRNGSAALGSGTLFASSAFSPQSHPMTDGHRAEALRFMSRVEKEDEARTAGRPQLHTASGQLVQNSNDLLAFLTASRRVGSWEAGMAAFWQATKLSPEAVRQGLYTASSPTTESSDEASRETTVHGGGKVPGERDTHRPFVSQSNANDRVDAASGGVSPTAEHVKQLIGLCVQSGQWSEVEAIGQFFGQTFPEVLTYTVQCLIEGGGQEKRRAPSGTPTTPDAAPTPGWLRGFRFLSTCVVPPTGRPVEAYNCCLTACEASKDWRGALRVVRAMGPNPLQGWRATEEGPATVDEASSREHLPSLDSSGDPKVGPQNAADELPPSSASPSEDASSPSSANEASPHHKGAIDASPAPRSLPPSPDVVSYATVIATLEQAGQDKIASQVLNRLPALEKEEITASYAALIYVWANQISHHSQKRF